MSFAASFPHHAQRAQRAAEMFGHVMGAGRGDWHTAGRGHGDHDDRHAGGRHGGHHGGHHGGRGGRGFGPGPFGGPGFGAGPGFRGGPGFGGFGFGGPRRRRRGSRASRGDIRLAALAVLADEPMHGYQLMREIDRRSNGIWRPSPGAVYPALQQLEDEGLIAADRADGKRVFTLTAEGTGYVEEHRGDIDAVWAAIDDDVDDDWQELATTGQQVMQAFFQVASAGNRRQITAANELMTRTRRQLYRILADDADTGADRSDARDDDPDDDPADPPESRD